MTTKIVEGEHGRLYKVDDREGEPVLSRQLVTAVGAILAVLIAFGAPLTQPQTAAVLAAVAVLAPIVGGLWARRAAWSGKTVAEVLRKATGGIEPAPDPEIGER